MARPLRDLAWTTLWTLACLVAIDLAIGTVLRMPTDPTRRARPLAEYFDYGRSIESKLRRMVRSTPETSSPRTRNGWLEPAAPTGAGTAPEVARPGTRLLSVYGQSFAFQLVDALARADSGWTLRSRGGPASPANHGFALWQVDRPRLHADVAVLGVLASSVPALVTNNSATWQFEAPPMYTYPRYRLDAAGRLAAAEPRLRSWQDLRATLDDPARMRAWEEQMARDDAAYDPFVWRASWLDRSTLGSLLRRAWAQRTQRERLARLHDRHGFRPGTEPVAVLGALVSEFAAGCRADGTLPAVLLLEDAGYSGDLRRLLGPKLDSLGVTWLATSELVDVNDPANLKGDAHFVPAVNDRLAAEFDRRLKAALAREGGRTTTGVRDGATGPGLIRPNSAK